MLDLAETLCYSMSYLSQERFLFARFFSDKTQKGHPVIQGGNARRKAGK